MQLLPITARRPERIQNVETCPRGRAARQLVITRIQGPRDRNRTGQLSDSATDRVRSFWRETVGGRLRILGSVLYCPSNQTLILVFPLTLLLSSQRARLATKSSVRLRTSFRDA